MSGLRAYGMNHDEGDMLPRLRAVSRVAPPRPRWRLLYLALLAVGAAGTAAEFITTSVTVARFVTVILGLLMFGILAGWVRLNRMALARLDEPEAGIGRSRIRVVRSRKPAAWDDDGLERLDRDDRVILPYDFR